MLRISLFISLLITSLEVHGQESGPPSVAPRATPVPILEISYYAGHEGTRRQELVRFELEEWTSDKDVIISSKWIEPSGLTSPGARSPSDVRNRNPLRDRWSRIPTHRQWFVEYTDAVTEGESHLFVNAVGLPKFSRQILSADDVFGYSHIPSYGWYEMRAAARAFREWAAENPTANGSTQPSPSDTQPGDTQNPLETRSR